MPHPTPATGGESGFSQRSPASRLRVDVHLDAQSSDTLAADVREGLLSTPKSLPPKYFYDSVGSELFDRICDTPEYYQTRTEQALLQAVAAEIVATVAPSDIIEFGSGSARKTRVLFNELQRSGASCLYVPFDVSESMLRRSADGLLRDYEWLRVHGIVGDYEHHLDRIPSSSRRLFLFLGSTIGNFEQQQAVSFLQGIARHMQPQDCLLLGTDLVKSPAVLNAAYNDAQGITAEFNKNLLEVINRELAADFVTDEFAHVAFFDAEQSRIEMHLESKRAQRVKIRALDLDVRFSQGERLLTEISRKFTRASVGDMLHCAGQHQVRWFSSPNDYFGLSLSRLR